MKHKFLVFALLIPFASGCQNNDNYVELTYPSYIYHHDNYKERFYFDDSYFSHSSYEYDSNLARLSLGLCLTTVETNTNQNEQEAIPSEFQVKKFYKKMGFEDVTFSDDYFLPTTKNTIGYALAHKKIGEKEVVSVVVRSFKYGQEMANNFLLGEEGHHQGYHENAHKIREGLGEYLRKNALNDSYFKLWVTGFARGGSITNNLGYIIDEEIASPESELNLLEEDAYFYTMQANPSIDASITSKNLNVHNVFNSKDIILLAPPEQYGLKRCGVDHDLYREDCISLIRKFDPTLPFEDFCSKELVIEKTVDYVDAKDPYYDISIFYSHICDVLFTKREDYEFSMATREEYVKDVQSAALYGFDMFYSLSEEQLDGAEDYLTEHFSPSQAVYLMFNKEDTLYEMLYPALDYVHCDYNKEELKKHCKTAQLLLYMIYLYDDTPLDDVATGFGNRRYIEAMHTPEMLSVLLSAEINNTPVEERK
ncbi:MAG: hypothetical protein IJ247_06920 [Bacilli bacterium]|nr:hypothetical protein [Bacilli bacterium]